jgi:hypothetical protein
MTHAQRDDGAGGANPTGSASQDDPCPRDAVVDDASGDALDAVLCLVQVAWGQQHYAKGDPLYGLPKDMDRLEGWILSA